MKMNQLTQAIALTLVLGGCTLAPKDKTPEVALAEQWVGVALKEQGGKDVAPSELGWRDFFTDPRLQKLITAALIYNHDLKKAALNVELAQAQYGISKADRLPTVGFNGGITRSRQGEIMGRSNISERYNVGLGISNFELDFFGRVKNQSKAALNKYLATKEARDAAQLSIINTVAKTYYQWRIAKALKDLAQETLATRQKTYRLTRLRFREGIAAGLSRTNPYYATSGKCLGNADWTAVGKAEFTQGKTPDAAISRQNVTCRCAVKGVIKAPRYSSSRIRIKGRQCQYRCGTGGNVPDYQFDGQYRLCQ